MCGRYGRWSRRQRIEELLRIDPSGKPDFSSSQTRGCTSRAPTPAAPVLAIMGGILNDSLN